MDKVVLALCIIDGFIILNQGLIRTVMMDLLRQLLSVSGPLLSNLDRVVAMPWLLVLIGLVKQYAGFDLL
jgi:hypothetical protein